MKKPRSRPSAAGPGYFTLDHIPTGGEVRVPFTPATMVDVGMNIPRRRSFYKNKRGILSTQRLEGSEFIVTVTKNPVADKKAAKPARLPSEVIADAAKTAAGFVGAPVRAFSDVFGECTPRTRHLKLFYRDAFIASLTMNEPERAKKLAHEATHLYRQQLDADGHTENDSGT